MVEILDGWGEQKLTWDLFIEAVELKLLTRYTRQTLSQYERIKHAFELVKNRSAHPQPESQTFCPPQIKILQDRIKRLEAENRRLSAENNQLLVQFVTWAYNAHTRGMDEDFLNRPLPKVNRGQTT